MEQWYKRRIHSHRIGDALCCSDGILQCKTWAKRFCADSRGVCGGMQGVEGRT
jgi:hypothetical protein